MHNEPTPLIVQGSSAMEMVPESISPEQYGEIALTEAKKAVDAANRAVASAKVVKITNDEEYRASDKAIAAFKTDMKGFENKRDGLVRPFNTAVKQINAVFKDAENGFKSAISCHTLPMSAYQAKLAEDRRKAEEAARIERERLEAIAAEEQRKAKAEFDRIQAEAEAAAVVPVPLDPFEALLAQDVAETAAARVQDAAEAYKQSIRDSRVEVAPAYVPKVTGSGSKTYTEWLFRIVNPELVPAKYKPVNESLVAKDVKEFKGEVGIPGIEIYSEIRVK